MDYNYNACNATLFRPNLSYKKMNMHKGWDPYTFQGAYVITTKICNVTNSNRLPQY